MLKKSFTNLILRGLVLLSKFLFSIFILKEISIESFGEYSLFVSTVTLGGFLFSWDYYQYVLREYVRTESIEKRKSLLGYQYYFHLMAFAILIPLFLFTIPLDLIATENIILFYLILLFDNISQEIFRTLIAAKRSFIANVLLFLRSASWIIFIIVLSLTEFRNVINLKFMLSSWLISAALSTAFGFNIIGINPIRIFFLRGKMKNIKLALKISSVFFLGTIGFKIFEMSGRFAAGIYFSKFEVGIFTFYFTIANLIYLIPQAGIFQVLGPQLIKDLSLSQEKEKKIHLLKFSIILIFVSIVTMLTILFCFDYLLIFIGKDDLTIYKNYLYYLTTGVLFFTFSFIPHYWLFSTGKDKEIMKSMLVGSALGILFIIFTIQYLGLFGIIIGVTVGFISIFVLKLYYALKANR